MTKKQKKLLQRITAAAVLFAAGMLLPLFAEVPAYIIFALFGISYIIIGWDIIWKAFCNIRQGEAFDENFLMTVATTGAFALGEYSEGVAVMLLLKRRGFLLCLRQQIKKHCNAGYSALAIK